MFRGKPALGVRSIDQDGTIVDQPVPVIVAAENVLPVSPAIGERLIDHTRELGSGVILAVAREVYVNACGEMADAFHLFTSGVHLHSIWQAKNAVGAKRLALRSRGRRCRAGTANRW